MPRKITSLFLTILICSTPIFSFAQEEMSAEAKEAIAQAHIDGTRDVDAQAFIAMGLLLNVIAFIGVTIIDSSPDVSRLVGKSPEYAKAYTKAYKEKSKSQRMKYTAAGCVAGTVAVACIGGMLWVGKQALE